MKNFVELVLDSGGDIKPLVIDSSLTNGTGIFNPSVFVDGDKIYVNIRHCQYTIFHSEEYKHEHFFGPLVYLHPENDLTLTTKNYFGELDENLSFKYYHAVDTSLLDKTPLWEFVGLEDCRIVKWNGKIYICGVRRDTTTNGEGRMELSELSISPESVKEISRWRIPAPDPNNSYCEKNWMPIVSEPYHFLKWCNPVQVVRADPATQTCVTTHLGQTLLFDCDQRGGGQVIPYESGYLSLTHETYLYTSEAQRKDATYRHRFVYWDKNWNIVKKSRAFSFMDAKIEFACGLAEYKDNLLVTFGFQDNCAFVTKFPKAMMGKFFNE